MTGADTKTEILDAAEHLFAEFGYAATSLRQITKAASANLAAVNYHFGSKEELAKAVLSRRIGPINEERLRRLDGLGKKAAVADIVRAFLAPPLRLGGTVNGEQEHSSALKTGSAVKTGFAVDGYRQRLCRMFGRISTEQPPFLRSFLAAQFRDVGSRFERALAAALPGKTATAIWWRIHFVVGAMAHTLQNSEALAHLTGNLCDPNDVDALEDQLVAFAAGGMSAAEPRRTRSSHSRETASRSRGKATGQRRKPPSPKTTRRKKPAIGAR